MNGKAFTPPWLAAFQHLSIDDEGDDTGGGGEETGAVPGAEGEGEAGGEAEVDLDSVDPVEIMKFPKGHILSRDQLRALTGYNPSPKAKPKDPTVEQQTPPVGVKKKAPVKEPVAAPAAGGLRPGQKKAGDPYYDPSVKRWRDGKTNKITTTPKGVAPPAAPKVASDPSGSSPAAIAAAAAAAAAKAVQAAQPPAPAPAPGEGGGGQKTWYGDLNAPMALPDEIVKDLLSDDGPTVVAAVNQTVNSLGNVIMRDMLQVMGHFRAEILSQVPGAVAAIAGHQKNSDGFYGRYPMLNNPVLHGAVDKVGAAVSQQFEANGVAWRNRAGAYTEDFMDAVATAFSEITNIPISVATAEDAGHVTPPVQKQQKPFFNRGPQARAADASREQMKSADIMATIQGRG